MKTVTMTVAERLKRSALMRHSLRNLERDSPILHTSSILAADGFRVSEYHLECVWHMHCPTIGWDAYVGYIQRKNTKVLSHKEVATHMRSNFQSHYGNLPRTFVHQMHSHLWCIICVMRFRHS